ncbi:similar to Saccharomyces cerevisiae YNL054W VAC7 Integral vacuolar membrane protein involved in vacuole inheritance and morphology [Maudiozyma barnettii]|uniref:Similar to Saccharomyces cerevisiae YNL054W VAC7 Integral vacuolar membrane protein involved in vacuole inheritance and morphology n=1 Tax=Maudiozyma barnettii TaxID=61262 RepID=A0A8H2VC53_9SACH|nr:Vac7p [Kazachstania barnettii]CAB4252539.1 similar to Saccharomyces cerevisiae YNL054W VAC7 Integral vacuolar membrane protein involved in vacuole inheritance and morphology [Kazachstania barnettii]CAD1779275.1 similar to Saccharomyces cerevisiae YNL054W VAC7 Integral vacuolar membrane protein involved in vacuole inheritance and morphology [Kazachstania barnettii]
MPPQSLSTKNNTDDNNTNIEDNNSNNDTENNNNDDEQHFIVETETVEAPVVSTLLNNNVSIIPIESSSSNVLKKDNNKNMPHHQQQPLTEEKDEILHPYTHTLLPIGDRTTDNIDGLSVDGSIIKEPPLNHVTMLPDSKMIPKDLNTNSNISLNLIDNNPLSSHNQNQSSLPLKNKKSSLLIDSNLIINNTDNNNSSITNVATDNNLIGTIINETGNSPLSNDNEITTNTTTTTTSTTSTSNSPQPLSLVNGSNRLQSATSIKKIINSNTPNNTVTIGNAPLPVASNNMIKELPLDSKRTTKNFERPPMHSMNSRDVLMTEKKTNPLVMSNNNSTNNNNNNNNNNINNVMTTATHNNSDDISIANDIKITKGNKLTSETSRDNNNNNINSNVINGPLTTNTDTDNIFTKKPTPSDIHKINENKLNRGVHPMINKSTDNLTHHNALSTDDLHSQLDDSSQKPTKTDFFAARLASAVGENEVSDSEETFVYESAANSTKNRIYPSSSNHVPQASTTANNTQHPSVNGSADIHSMTGDVSEPQHGVIPKMSAPLLNSNKKLMARLKNPRHISTSGIPLSTAGPNNISATGSHIPTNYHQNPHSHLNGYSHPSVSHLPPISTTVGSNPNTINNSDKIIGSPVTNLNPNYSGTTPTKMNGSPNVNNQSNSTHTPGEELSIVRSFNKTNRSHPQDMRPMRPYILDHPKSPNKRSSIASLTKSSISQQSASYFPPQQLPPQNTTSNGIGQRAIPNSITTSLRQMAPSSLQHNNSINSSSGMNSENKKGLRTTVSKIFDTNETPLRIYSGVPDNVNLEDFIDQSDNMGSIGNGNGNNISNNNNTNIPMVNNHNSISGSMHNHSLNGLNNQNSVKINNYMNSNDGKRVMRNSINGYQQCDNNNNNNNKNNNGNNSNNGPYYNERHGDNENHNGYQNYGSINNNKGDYIYKEALPIREEDEAEYSSYRNSHANNSNGGIPNELGNYSKDYSTRSNNDNSNHIRNTTENDDLQSMFYYNHRANLEARPEISDYEDDEDDDVGEDEGGNRSFFARHNFLPSQMHFTGNRHPSYSFSKQPPVQGTFYDYTMSPTQQQMGHTNEYTALRGGPDQLAPAMTTRRKYSRSNNGYSPHDFYGKKSTWSKLKSAFYFSFVMTVLVTIGFIFGFIIATNKELQDFNVVLVDNVISTTDELLFDITASAFNPGFFSISIFDSDLDIFAKSDHIPNDDDDNGGDGNESDPFKDRNEDSTETIFLGTVSKLDPELKFSGGFFNRKYDVSMTSLKIKNPAKNEDKSGRDNTRSSNQQEDPDGSEKWEEIIKYNYDLIIRGNLRYKIPFFNNDRSIAVQRTANVPKGDKDKKMLTF